jgi:hypothetical protein
MSFTNVAFYSYHLPPASVWILMNRIFAIVLPFSCSSLLFHDSLFIPNSSSLSVTFTFGKEGTNRSKEENSFHVCCCMQIVSPSSSELFSLTTSTSLTYRPNEGTCCCVFRAVHVCVCSVVMDERTQSSSYSILFVVQLREMREAAPIMINFIPSVFQFLLSQFNSLSRLHAGSAGKVTSD